jgi:hypothetical protein
VSAWLALPLCAELIRRGARSRAQECRIGVADLRDAGVKSFQIKRNSL